MEDASWPFKVGKLDGKDNLTVLIYPLSAARQDYIYNMFNREILF